MAATNQNLIVEKTEQFALQVISLYSLLQEQREFVLSRQLLRSSTSIGANVSEAIAAQSTSDFIHKLSVALKEAHESKYWLRLLQKSQLVRHDYQPYYNECTSIIRILSKIIVTTKSSHKDHL